MPGTLAGFVDVDRPTRTPSPGRASSQSGNEMKDTSGYTGPADGLLKPKYLPGLDEYELTFKIPDLAKPVRYNILLVGENLGRSTCLKRAFQGLINKPVTISNGTKTSVSQFQQEGGAEGLRTVVDPPVILKNDHSKYKVHYSIQDTPSLGDIDTQEVEDAIMKHLESLWQAQLSSRLDWVCTRDVNGINLEALKQDQPDLLPDVCLFFVGPQPKERDLRFMTRLSKLVSVVPVIALADCMTLAECQDCQQKIFDHLQKEKFYVALEEEVEAAALALNIPEASQYMPPFPVPARVSSEGRMQAMTHITPSSITVSEDHWEKGFVLMRDVVLKVGYTALRQQKQLRFALALASRQSEDDDGLKAEVARLETRVQKLELALMQHNELPAGGSKVTTPLHSGLGKKVIRQ